MSVMALDDFIDDNDFDDEEDYGPDSYHDERRDKLGTSECDGTCVPQCSWCLVGHVCPDECEGGECPYDALAKGAR